jgi:hypothetical protein
MTRGPVGLLARRPKIDERTGNRSFPQRSRFRRRGSESSGRGIPSGLTPWIYRADLHDFSEIHGDRAFGDDEAVACGMARLNGEEVLVIGNRKGGSTKERVRRNFGMPHPEGYRKALRCMKIAEKFSRP